MDLGIDIPIDEFTSWMCPRHTNAPSFEYPGDRLHRLSDFIPDYEMLGPARNTHDHLGDPVIMVMKRGYGSGLTVGRLNTIRSFTRYVFEDKPGKMSRDVAVLPRNSNSGPFSRPGDSGSSVVDGKGRISGMITGGAGVTDILDCTYVASINFLRNRMLAHGLEADCFSPALQNAASPTL